MSSKDKGIVVAISVVLRLFQFFLAHFQGFYRSASSLFLFTIFLNRDCFTKSPLFEGKIVLWYIFEQTGNLTEDWKKESAKYWRGRERTGHMRRDSQGIANSGDSSARDEIKLQHPLE